MYLVGGGAMEYDFTACSESLKKYREVSIEFDLSQEEQTTSMLETPLLIFEISVRWFDISKTLLYDTD